MADSTIGSAYLQVVPKLEKGALESEMKSAGKSGSSTFSSSFSTGMASKAVAIGNVMSTALLKGVDAASQAASELFVKSFESYAEYEQLAGGVEKIFDEMDNSQIFKDAGDAWRDLNMSANDYMATINDVGAMFSATMGDQAAYDAARKGMKAISDYASGTGKNLDLLNEKFAMITRATSSYQSIADQFAGILPATSADFLEQAQAAGFLSDEYTKLTQVPINEYQEALVNMLEKGTRELGLYGNTAAETAHTITGSIAGLKSAWSNFLTGIADENADMGKLTDDLVEAFEAAVDNVLPRVQEIAERMGPAIADAVSNALHYISPEAGDAFDRIAGAVGSLADALGHIAEQAAASGVLDDVAMAITNISDSIANADFGPFFDLLGDGLEKIGEFRTFMKNWNAEAAMENGGMFGEWTDPSTWHLFSEESKTFQRDLEALGGSVYEYGELSDKTMRQVADAYRENGHDMEEALASANLVVDSATGKIIKYDKQKLGDKYAKVDLDDGQLVDAQGRLYTWDGTKLLDKYGNATVDDKSLVDAQGNVMIWNGTDLVPKDTSVNVAGADAIRNIISLWNNWQPQAKNAVANVMGTLFGASGGFYQMHGDGGFITNGAMSLGTDKFGINHIVGEAGREWVMSHADGTASVVPIENRKYLKPYAGIIAGMLEANGGATEYNIVVNAAGDGDAIAREVTRAIRAQNLMSGRRMAYAVR